MKSLATGNSPSITNNPLLYREEFLSIYHKKADHLIYADWTGHQNDQTIKTGSEFLLNAIRETRSYKLINDNTHITGMKANTVAWLANDFSPRLQKAGLQYLAWIYKTRSFSGPSADTVISTSKTDIIVVVFDKVSNAENWLKSVH